MFYCPEKWKLWILNLLDICWTWIKSRMLMKQLRTISSSIWKSEATESYLDLGLNLGRLRGFFILVWIWGNWEFSLSRFEFGATERFPYLSLNLGWLRAFLISVWIWVAKRCLYLGLNLWWLRGFSISVWIWGDWELSLSRSKSRVIKSFLYLGRNLGRLRGFFILVRIWGDWELSLSRSEFGLYEKKTKVLN